MTWTRSQNYSHCPSEVNILSNQLLSTWEAHRGAHTGRFRRPRAGLATFHVLVSLWRGRGVEGGTSDPEARTSDLWKPMVSHAWVGARVEACVWKGARVPVILGQTGLTEAGVRRQVVVVEGFVVRAVAPIPPATNTKDALQFIRFLWYIK